MPLSNETIIHGDLTGANLHTVFRRVVEKPVDLDGDQNTYLDREVNNAFALVTSNDNLAPQIYLLTSNDPNTWSPFDADTQASAAVASAASLSSSLSTLLASPFVFDLSSAGGVGINWEPSPPIENGTIRSSAALATASAALYIPDGYQRASVTLNVKDHETPSRILTARMYRRDIGESPVLLETKTSDGSGLAQDIIFTFSPGIDGPTMLIATVTTPNNGGIFLYWNSYVLEA